MKHSIITLALCTLSAWASAQTVTVADVEALPGETVSFTLNLSGGKVDTYTAMQFDVQFPVTGFATTGRYTIAEQWSNATAIIGSIDANGMATIPVASSEAITGADVEGLLSVSFTVGSDVATGEYDVTLTNLWFGYGTSSKDYLADVTFKVHVVAAHSVLLDENATEAPEAAEGVNVRVLRTIKGGQWSTICLPFAMSEAQCKEAFGSDVEIADFTGVETTFDEGDNVVGLTVNFADAAAIEANHPYIIKVSESVSEFSVDGVDVDPQEEYAAVDCDEKSEKIGRQTYYFYNSLVGTYTAGTVVPEMCLFLSDNSFWYSTGATTMKAFRAYFDFYDVLTEAEQGGSVAGIRMSFGHDTATGIGETAGQQHPTGICYDLQGRRVSQPTAKRLYILEGRKIIVK